MQLRRPTKQLRIPRVGERLLQHLQQRLAEVPGHAEADDEEDDHLHHASAELRQVLPQRHCPFFGLFGILAHEALTSAASGGTSDSTESAGSSSRSSGMAPYESTPSGGYS